MARNHAAASSVRPISASIRAPAARASKSAGSSAPSRTTISAAPARSPRPRRRASTAFKLGLGVGEESLFLGDLGEIELGAFVVRRELEELLVDGGGLRVEPLDHEVFGDACVLAGGHVGLSGADIEVAERVGGRPVPGWSSTTRRYSAMAASSCPWRSSFSAFFSVSSRSMGTWVYSTSRAARAGDSCRCGPYGSILSNRVGGRNERRCTSE